MNLYELICNYCGFSWKIDYSPRVVSTCDVCKDTNIRVIDISGKSDYYIGCPPFPDKQEKWNI